MLVRFKKLNKNAVIPSYGSPFSAGCDLSACLEEKVEIAPHTTVKIPTGLAMELPLNTVGLIYARSGMATKRHLAPANKVGVVDADYRGEIIVAKPIKYSELVSKGWSKDEISEFLCQECNRLGKYE